MHWILSFETVILVALNSISRTKTVTCCYKYWDKPSKRRWKAVLCGAQFDVSKVARFSHPNAPLKANRLNFYYWINHLRCVHDVTIYCSLSIAPYRTVRSRLIYVKIILRRIRKIGRKISGAAFMCHSFGSESSAVALQINVKIDVFCWLSTDVFAVVTFSMDFKSEYHCRACHTSIGSENFLVLKLS